MVEIFPPDANVIKIMRTPQWTREQTLRRSAFALLFEHRGGHYCFHTFTKQCFRLEETELPLLIGPSDGAEAAERPALKALAAARFLVPEDADETRDYESVFHILRLLEQ